MNFSGGFHLNIPPINEEKIVDEENHGAYIPELEKVDPQIESHDDDDDEHHDDDDDEEEEDEEDEEEEEDEENEIEEQDGELHQILEEDNEEQDGDEGLHQRNQFSGIANSITLISTIKL